MAWHINNRKKERTSHVRSIFFPFMPIAVCVFFFIHSVHRCICFACSTPVKLKSLSFSREHFTVELFSSIICFRYVWFLCHANNGRTFFRFWCFKFNLFFEHVLRCEREREKNRVENKKNSTRFLVIRFLIMDFCQLFLVRLRFYLFRKSSIVYWRILFHVLTFNISSYIFKALHCVAPHYKAPFNAHTDTVSLIFKV